jgi:hypothetical protein
MQWEISGHYYIAPTFIWFTLYVTAANVAEALKEADAAMIGHNPNWNITVTDIHLCDDEEEEEEAADTAV